MAMDIVETDLRRWLAEDRASLLALNLPQRPRVPGDCDAHRLQRRIERCEAWLRVLGLRA